MTREWIEQNFTVSDGGVTVYTSLEVDITCGLDWLAETIGTAKTYADLSALPIAAQGWQKVFDYWKERGIIS